MYKKTKKKFTDAIDLDRHIFLCRRIKAVKGFKIKLEVIPYQFFGSRTIKIKAESSFFFNYYMYKNSEFYRPEEEKSAAKKRRIYE